MATSSHHSLLRRGPTRRGWQALAAVGGGVLWTLVPVVYGIQGIVYSVEALDIVPLALVPALAPPLLVLGVRGFHERYASSYSPWGRGGLWALALGLVGLWPFALLEFVSVGMGAGIAIYATAIAAGGVVELGTIGVAIDCWRSGVPSRRMAVWFPPALPLSALVNYWAAHLHDHIRMGGHYYAGLFGVAWIAVGYRLLKPAQTTEQR